MSFGPPPPGIGPLEPMCCGACGQEFMWHHGEGECVRNQLGGHIDEMRAEIAVLRERVARLEGAFDDGK